MKIKVKKDHKDITLLNKIFYEDETESEPYHQVSKIEKSFFVGKSMNLTNLLKDVYQVQHQPRRKELSNPVYFYSAGKTNNRGES